MCNMKVSVSARLDEGLLVYLDSYRRKHDVRTRSEALERAIRALQTSDLKREYALAMSEWEASGEGELWEKTAGDGLEPPKDGYEAW